LLAKAGNTEVVSCLIAIAIVVLALLARTSFGTLLEWGRMLMQSTYLINMSIFWSFLNISAVLRTDAA